MNKCECNMIYFRLPGLVVCYNLKTQSLKEICKCPSGDQFPVLLDRPCGLRQSYVCGCEVNKGKWRGGLSTNTRGGKED
ncbi:hypothetical protein PanWU01x14_252450 [Parasponia andersonii]|uniref:Uncharacterized protein n=1 Tax=Parasponia andersonii TaxID=3476 RepID=A0A2P5BBY4_PARAD|nr:hypothetical protein PanWU01x14_252450 [Parasponia andersonii]